MKNNNNGLFDDKGTGRIARGSKISITESSLRYVQAHALSFPKIEIAGALIGYRPTKQADETYSTLVFDAIAGKHLKTSPGSVQLTADFWKYVNEVMRNRYPNEEAIIAGWYHTHPNLGVFFSNADVVVHQVCFRQPFHVGLVVDPHKPLSSSRFFGWAPNKEITSLNLTWPEWVDSW